MNKPAEIGQKLNSTGQKVGEAVTGAGDRAWADLQPVFDYKLIHTSNFDVTLGGVLGAFFALVIAWMFSKWLQRTINRYGERQSSSERAALYTISRVAHYVLLATAIGIALSVLGIPLGKFGIFAGAVGVGLGFGLQSVFSNFISGLILLFDRSLKVGDFVELDQDVRGTVRAVNIRSTRITTNDNIDLLVPNSEFVNGRVVNWTHRSVNRRIRVPFHAAYGVDKEVVKKAALEAAAEVPFTLTVEGTQAPQVWLVEFGESRVDYLLVVWLNEDAARRNIAIRAAYLWALDTALKKYGIEMPLPQRDLNIRSLFGLSGKDAFNALHGQRNVGEASPQHELSAAEREKLSRNDAQEDAQVALEKEDEPTPVADASVTKPTFEEKPNG